MQKILPSSSIECDLSEFSDIQECLTAAQNSSSPFNISPAKDVISASNGGAKILQKQTTSIVRKPKRKLDLLGSSDDKFRPSNTSKISSVEHAPEPQPATKPNADFQLTREFMQMALALQLGMGQLPAGAIQPPGITSILPSSVTSSSAAAPSLQITSSVVIKVKTVFGDDARKFSLDQSWTFDKLLSCVKEAYNISSPCVLKYTDEDGDCCKMTNQLEFQGFLDSFPASKLFVRLDVQLTDPPPTQLSASPTKKRPRRLSASPTKSNTILEFTPTTNHASSLSSTRDAILAPNFLALNSRTNNIQTNNCPGSAGLLATALDTLAALAAQPHTTRGTRETRARAARTYCHCKNRAGLYLL